MGQLTRVPAAIRILIALAAGIGVGLAMPAPGQSASADGFAAAAGVIGELWLSALQMTILPLVFALLATGFARSTGTIGSGALTWRTMRVILALYALAAICAVIAVRTLMQLLPVDPGQAAAMRTAELAADAPPLDVMAMFANIVPTNIVAAAADGAMLPIVVFALLFGAALMRIGHERRDALIGFLTGLADTMFVIVGWIMVLAPLGVFGLILPTVHEHGTDLLFGLASYLRFVVIIAIVTWLCAYPVAFYAMRRRFGTFVRNAAPAQAVAFGCQSSLATLPVMLRCARRMGVPEVVAGTSLPLCVTVFRISAPFGSLAVAAYGAMVYGTGPGITAMLLAAMVAVAIEFGMVGLPNQVNMIASTAPICAILGVPVEFLALIIAVDTLPDMFYTAANVSMDLAATGVVASETGFEVAEEPVAAPA